MKNIFTKTAILFVFVACVATSCDPVIEPKPNDNFSNEIEFGIRYSEVYPIEDRTQIIFLDEKKLEIHNKNSMREYEYSINIKDTTILLRLDGMYTSHYFNLISRTEFKIGNLYFAPSGDPTEPTIIMTFEKNNVD